MERKESTYLPLSARKGKIPYTLRNDYLFKVVLESDEDILHSLLCSLLFLKKDDILSARVTNPILPGEAIDFKTVILDIRLILNDKSVLNLEMQNLDKGDWPERSLVYLCRTFDHIKKGEASYRNVMPAHHISILDFSLPHLSKEFYSHFYMMNPKTYEIYSDKLCLSVLNLKHGKLATAEEKRHGLDKWARAFLADTWEEFQMLASENTDFKKVADSVYKVLADEGQREACRRYEEQRAEMEQALRQIDEQKETIREQNETIQEQGETIQEQGETIQEQSTELQKAKLKLQEKDALIEKLKKDLDELKK